MPQIQKVLRARAATITEYGYRAGALQDRPKRTSFRFFASIMLAFVGLALFTAAHAAKRPARDTTPPTVTITSPTAGSIVQGSVFVAVSATDNVGVVQVNLLVNGATVASRTTAPYTFSWDSTKVANGAVTLAAAAYDRAGNRASASETVTVSNSIQPPSVGISSPASGSTVKGTVAVSISASGAVAIARVDLKAKGLLIGSSTTAPYAFSWDTTTVPDGSVILSASAYDTAGNSATASSNETVANTPTTTTTPTLSVTSLNPTSGVSIRVYPADTSGLGDGTSSLSRTYQPSARIWLAAALRSGSNYFIKWQKDGVDYDTASTTSVVMDANHTFTAVYETPSCVGVSVYPGTDSIKNAVAAYPAGTTFCIKAGTHRLTTSITAQTGDKYIGETGAILNGSKILTSFQKSGSYWVATGQYQQEPTFSPSLCLGSAPSCIYPEKVFVDGNDLWQVTSLSTLGTGQFYFDYANAAIYLFDDPTGHLVEATTGAGGIIGYSGGSSDNVVVKNLIFEKFGGGDVIASSHNVLKAVDGWRVENNEVRFNSYIGVANYGNGAVRNNYIHHNGEYGLGGGGLIEGNTIANNNTDGFDPNNDAGGSKFLRTIGLVVRGNTASSNTGRGFWTDYDNLNAMYENNIIENNTEMGIFHEVSCAVVIRNNVARGNNSAMAGKSLWNGGQIYARSSKDMQIYGNDVTAAGPGTHGISLRGGDAPYSTTNCGTVQLQNIQVHDNVIRLDTGDQNGMVGGYAGYGATYNIQFSNNTYYLTDLTGVYFLFDAASTVLPKEQWQALGQDVTGKFYQY
jgi:hypothetical protein